MIHLNDLNIDPLRMENLVDLRQTSKDEHMTKEECEKVVYKESFDTKYHRLAQFIKLDYHSEIIQSH